MDKLIDKVKKRSERAGNAAFWGFVYLMGAIVVLFIFNLWPLFFPAVSPVIEVCEKNPKEFDMTPNLCTRIKPGSLYEECVFTRR